MELLTSSKRGMRGLLLAASLLGAMPLASCTGAGESSQRYRFDVLNQPVPVGAHTELTIKLTDTTSGQPVQGATISSAGLEMTHKHPSHKGSLPPGWMTTTVSGDVTFIGSFGPGLYQVMADISTPGTWKLDLSANVPGEMKPIREIIKIEARR